MYHKRINTKNTTEHFTNQETNKLLSDINIYCNKRKRILNDGTSLTRLKLDSFKRILNENVPKDSFAPPVIIKNDVETNEIKVKSESPMYVPVNLYVDGTLNIKNVNNNDKNLCMGDNCYTEKDIQHLIQDFLPYFEYSSKTRNKSDIKSLCFESYESIHEVFELGELEELTIRENLDYTGQLIQLRDIVKNYNININTDRSSDEREKQIINLVLGNIYRTDYNVFIFFEKYPEMIGIFKKHYNSSVNTDNLKQYLKDSKYKTKEKYENIRKTMKQMNYLNTKDYCIDGDDLKILRGEKDVKFYTKQNHVTSRTNSNGWERKMSYMVDWLRKQFSKTPNDFTKFDKYLNWGGIYGYIAKIFKRQAKARYEAAKTYKDNDIYYEKSIYGNNLTDYPYLNEMHFEVHGINDDDSHCMNYKKLKIATMSKSKKGDEAQRNGSFKMELQEGKAGETGIFCKPE